MRIILGIITVIVLSSGLFTHPPVHAQTNSYFPLEPGRHFSFATDYFAPPFEYVTVLGTERFYGQTVWVIQWDYLQASDTRFEFYSIAPDGDVFYHGVRTAGSDLVEVVFDPPFRILDMPDSPGQTWTDFYSWTVYINGALDSVVPGYSFSGEILSTDSDVAVPAGSFSALEISGKIVTGGVVQTQRTTYWMAKDIGVVRRESSTDGQPGVVFELLWSLPLSEEAHSWGSVKALFR